MSGPETSVLGMCKRTHVDHAHGACAPCRGWQRGNETPPTPEGHTAGPWVAKGAQVFGADGYRVGSTDGVHVRLGWRARRGQHWGTTPGAAVERAEKTEEANARVMAEAPTLLALLKEFQSMGAELCLGCVMPGKRHHRVCAAATAAIARATGSAS